MVSIKIDIEERVYAAVDSVRKQNTVTTPHPDHPEKAVIGPAFDSVEDWLKVIVSEWLSQFAAQAATPEQTALAEKIKADMQQLQEMNRATISVKRG